MACIEICLENILLLKIKSIIGPLLVMEASTFVLDGLLTIVQITLIDERFIPF
jgi:hypothetical protein